MTFPMNMIINESLRLYTPVETLREKLNAQPNWRGSAFQHIWDSLFDLWHLIMRLEYGEKFNPKRLLQGAAKAANNNTALYVPFGLGSRSCVGSSFATNEAKIALSMILHRFTLTLCPIYFLSPVVLLIVRPQHGIPSMVDTHSDTASNEMNMIINESLRLYPRVILLPRIVKHEAKLGKFSVPANTILLIPTLSIHHDTQIWGEDAQQFKPERFSEGVSKATNNNPAVFLPFDLGPRSCVGLNFAMNEAKIALVMILQHYAFTLSPAYIHLPIVMLTSLPQHRVQ
ncbi:hypothetical protein RJ639_041207, partial [Escallonia herrerae]